MERNDLDTELHLRDDVHDDLERSDGSTLGLVSGVVNDMRELVSAHVSAARLEIKDELRQLTKSMKKAVAAAVIGGVGAILIGLALGWLLVDAGLPAWAGHGIVGVLAATVAVVLGLAAKNQAKDNDGIPEREIERARHDARWVAKRARAAAQDDGRPSTH